MTRKLNNRNIRRLTRSGNSLYVSIPIELVRDLGWREKQKVVVKKRGEGFVVEDWKPKTSKL